MQTFLPYENLIESAKCLDNKRLNKQIMECLQIVKAIFKESKGWVNHPVTKMWQNSPNYVVEFGLCCCETHKKRNGTIHSYWDKLKLYDGDIMKCSKPWWFGWDKIHKQYRANLLYKQPEWYNRFNWKVEPDGRRFYPKTKIGQLDIRI